MSIVIVCVSDSLVLAENTRKHSLFRKHFRKQNRKQSQIRKHFQKHFQKHQNDQKQTENVNCGCLRFRLLSSLQVFLSVLVREF